MIHPSAIVSPEAVVGDGVSIGPYAVVEADVEIGEGSRLESHAVLRSGSRIGKSVTIGNFAVIGGLPQDLGFDWKRRTYARIGDGSTIREGVTVNRATVEGGSTVVGEGCYLMAASHLGHDCQVGAKVILANAVLLAGHVSVGDGAFMGGAAAVHQFCRIGAGAMVGGAAAVSADVPPFTMAAERNALFGLNLVGLRRRGLDRASIAALERCYKGVFGGAGSPRSRAAALLEEGAAGEVEEARRFLGFFAGGKRGFARPGRKGGLASEWL